MGSVNSLIDPDAYSLQYSSIDDAIESCLKLAPEVPLMAKIDLKDAYKHIPIHPSDWHMMGFAWPSAGSKRYYFSKVLSFGLRSAPALFDRYARCLSVFAKYEGCQSDLIRYVDDFLIISPSIDRCQADLDCLIRTSRWAGFSIQESKVTSPGCVVEFLGIIIDARSCTLRISGERLSEIIAILEAWKGRRTCSKRQLLKLVGKLAFAARAIRRGRAFLGRLIGLAKKLKYLHFRTRLTKDALRDIHWWTDSINSHNGTSFAPRDWSRPEVIHIYSDASDHGCGAWTRGEWFALSYTGQFAPLRDHSINWRELHVAVKALATWAPHCPGSAIVIHIDNQAAGNILSKLYSPCSELMELVRIWALLLEHHRIDVRIEYVNTADNYLADALSRGAIADFIDNVPHAVNRVWPESINYFNAQI